LNKLQTEKSPYLLQHLDNPVNWFPWREEAFSLARDKNRLIFLSIGYSTCHWCHVMAHESFEDQDVAELLNRDYISIKVDREERPDIDQVYMEVCQRLTGSGGWPLTIIMTPDAKPFYAATYLPKQGRHGRPGMMELLPWVSKKWQEEADFLENSASEVQAMLQRRFQDDMDLPGKDVFSAAERALKSSYDRHHGGFSRAPKFPRPHDLVFLLNQYTETGDRECLAMVEKTLLHMRCGGIYDQLGFGFHRYSTDEQWLLPHFEKMLYDQAGLVTAFLAAWSVTRDDFYAMTVRESITYLTRDLLTDKGAFCSAEDADSEGEEGKFYVWSHSQVEKALGAQVDSFCGSYNVKRAGNYHDEVSGRLSGNNILHLSVETTKDASRVMKELSGQRDTLFAIRNDRIRPHLDDKIITSWNGMTLSALAESARLLGEDEYLRQAEVLADFLLDEMFMDGRLLRRYRDGEAAIPGFAEDYASVAKGLLDLYNLTFECKYLFSASSVAKGLRDLFQDLDTGRLYDTSHDAEKLLIRPSSAFDGAMPAATSVALEVFARLFYLSGDQAWHDAGESLLKSLSAEISRYPAGYTALLTSAKWIMKPTREVIISGKRGEAVTEAMLTIVRQSNLSRTVVLFNPGDNTDLLLFASYLKSLPIEDDAAAYVCTNFSCQTPVTDPQDLHSIMANLPE
jgi:uncharacterized protein YyaL (SSP411 family)